MTILGREIRKHMRLRHLIPTNDISALENNYEDRLCKNHKIKFFYFNKKRRKAEIRILEIKNIFGGNL